MGAIGGEELVNWEKMQGSGSAREEKILVLVRLRPLSDKEIAKNEVSDWECINNNSILFRNSLQERSMFPTAYTFDRVFGGECPTRMVYDSGAKEIALSVVSGINSSIFAYGQTSSGKTYTMIGITEYTVADIYNYIEKHEERAFVLKFSAMEIYNEAVRDLLSTDNMPLRVLDDPEKGTIVEKLTEETLRGWSHLRDLLSVCEAQRQTGETNLNETSSRSHQILRLTIESTAREFIGKDKSTTTTLAASVNFVDLAGSERAAQALSVGQRLKEGCHINRSLLTLSTVIRKLSKGRQGHVNYRDSKLTRILQPCLGGNARTAIICTLSPARSHVEQSRNTLLFASCAKEVSTNAQVNVVMSDKALVKHLQKELARLESELRTPAPTSTSDYAVLLRKKDLQIDKLEKEVKELTKQRNLAQSRIEELLTAIRKNQEEFTRINNKLPENNEDDYISDDDESSPSNRNDFAIPQEHSDDNCKDVRCIETDESASRSPVFEESSATTTRETSEEVESGFAFGSLERNIQDVQNTIDSLATPYDGEEQSSWARTPPGVRMVRSWSCREKSVTGSSSNGGFGQNDSTPPPNSFERNFTGRPEGFQRRLLEDSSLKRNDSQSSIGSVLTESQDNNNGDEDIPTVDSFVAGLKEMAKAQYDYQGGDDKSGNNVKDVRLDATSVIDWPMEFERQQKLIFELWETCNVSVVHRTYFFLLFRGDPTDSIYMEVEIRRLSFLKEKFSGLNSSVEDGQALTYASSVKSLRRERETLSRLMYRRFSGAERNRMYEKWGIRLESKRRRLQLVQRLWRDTNDMNHIQESASIVAKLVRFSEQGQTLKGMLGLSFTPPRISRRSFGWKNSMASLL